MAVVIPRPEHANAMLGQLPVKPVCQVCQSQQLVLAHNLIKNHCSAAPAGTTVLKQTTLTSRPLLLPVPAQRRRGAPRGRRSLTGLDTDCTATQGLKKDYAHR